MLTAAPSKKGSAVPAETTNSSSLGREAPGRGDPECRESGLPCPATLRQAQGAGLAMTSSAQTASKNSGPWPLNQAGLTLIEVLVALLVLALAMTAVIKTSIEHIRATRYLQEKTLAAWVGLNAINKTRLELIQLPELPEHETVHERMLGQDWEWQGYIKKTANAHIQIIQIQVFHLPEHHLITELRGYRYGR